MCSFILPSFFMRYMHGMTSDLNNRKDIAPDTVAYHQELLRRYADAGKGFPVGFAIFLLQNLYICYESR